MEQGFIALVLLVLGIVIGRFLFKRPNRESRGVLNVDCSDPESQPGLWLQLDIPIADVVSQKQITLDVNVIRNISHK